MKKLLLCLLVFGLGSIAYAQSGLRIGYVNSETIINELPEAKDAQSKLQDLVSGWQDEIKKRSDALQAKYDDYQKQSNMLNDAAKQSRQKELLDEEQQLNQYRTEKQQELATQREQIMKPIQDKVYQAIEKVAKEKKLNFVFDKAQDVPLLYADPKFDYTPDVLIYLKRGGK